MEQHELDKLQKKARSSSNLENPCLLRCLKVHLSGDKKHRKEVEVPASKLELDSSAAGD